MGIEEKAKAYDMALEAARKELGVDRKEWKVVQRVLHNIFPELRESEDEKIRMWLIDCVKATHDCYFETVTREQVLYYLEKQKYDRMKPVYDNQDSFESALEKAWKDYNDSGARTVDGCEDNYVECAHAKGFREGYLFGIEKQKEQKHDGKKWIYEDEYHKDLVRLYNEGKDKVLENPGKYGLCKVAEWSKENDKTISELKTHIELCNGFNRENKRKAFSLIDSLRPQPRWKPSEEQMEALHTAVYLEEMQFYGGLKDKLRVLYEQLKQL